MADAFLVPATHTADIVGSCSSTVTITWAGPPPTDPTVQQCTSLRAAITEANSFLGGSHEVLLEAGMYEISIAGGSENANATGDLDVTSGDVTIKGMGSGPSGTQIDGTAIKTAAKGLADRLLQVHPTATVFLNRVRLQNGGTHDGGGAVFNEGTLHADDVEFWYNLNDQTFATNYPGGAVYNKGTATLVDVWFQDNEVREWHGGALGNVNGDVTIFASNRDHSRFEQNEASVGHGGAIYSDGGTVDIEDTVVSSSKATFMGGCIHLYRGAILTMEQSSIDECTQTAGHVSGDPGGNIVKGGGALSLGRDLLGAPPWVTTPAEAYLTNVAIGVNNAGGYGGAIYVQDGIGAVDLDYVTLSKNVASALSYGGNDISFECGGGTGCTASNSVIDKGCVGVSAVAGTANLEQDYTWKGGAVTCTGFSILGNINGLGWSSTGVGNMTVGEFIDPTSDAWEAGPTATPGQLDQTGLTRNGPTDLGAWELSP